MFMYMIAPDPDYCGFDFSKEHACFVTNEDQLENRIMETALFSGGNYPINVYKLDTIHKMKTKPTYARYKHNEYGEIVPA